MCIKVLMPRFSQMKSFPSLKMQLRLFDNAVFKKRFITCPSATYKILVFRNIHVQHQQSKILIDFRCVSIETVWFSFLWKVDEACCPGSGSHPIIHFKMNIKRKSIYYDYIVIAPTIMLCILTLASFWLPCHHGEKIAIGLTVFLTLYVLQLLIAENVPDTNTTPVLGWCAK